MEFEAWNQVPAAPEKQPADYLNDIKVAEVTADTKTLSYTLPEDVPEGYKIKYNGTDYEQVIDLNGTIYRPISDVTVKASFKIENTKDNTDYAFKEFDVKVPGSMTAKAEDVYKRQIPHAAARSLAVSASSRSSACTSPWRSTGRCVTWTPSRSSASQQWRIAWCSMALVTIRTGVAAP